LSQHSSTSNVPYVGKINIPYENVGACISKDSTLMGKFSLPPPTNVTSVNMILSSNDPWIIPSPDKIDNFGDNMPLKPIEQAYQAILMGSVVASETMID